MNQSNVDKAFKAWETAALSDIDGDKCNALWNAFVELDDLVNGAPSERQHNVTPLQRIGL